MPINRRDLFRQSAGAGLALAALGRGAFPALGAPTNDRVFVVVQMSGGNDGLSTVVPFGEETLYRVRRTTAVAAKEVIRLGDGIGLHPGLSGLRPAWDAGRLAVVLGAGYPNPNRSHFESMDIWQTASPRGRQVPTGWLGRALDAGAAGDAGAEASIHVGERVPYALESVSHDAIAIRYAEAYRWFGRSREQQAFEALNAARRGDDDPAWLHREAAEALASSARVRRTVSKYRPKSEYPTRGSLGRDLSLAAALIVGGIRARVISVETGGFDTHTQQQTRHDTLMHDLGDALGAFLADLEAQGVADRVVVMAFSEFGRRVAENASGGTDHGTAAPLFLVGRPLKGGLYGTQPSLDHLDHNGDLVFTTDFRRVYATILDRWLGVDAKRVLDGAYEGLGMLG